MKKQTKKKKFRSLFRYPGGKSRVTKLLDPFINLPHKEYREPFIGGGSIFLFKDKVEKNWINDFDPDMYYAWKGLQECPDKIIELITSFF